MKVVCVDEAVQAGHAPLHEYTRRGFTSYPECPERYEVLRRALGSTSWAQLVDVQPQGEEPVRHVHDASYIAFLRQLHETWNPRDEELAASIFSSRTGRRPPGPLAAAVGYFAFDTTPITVGTWPAAREAANAALTAADLVLAGESAAYALCRPPGHHASASQLGGYCFFNQAALVADRLAAQGPVAVIDIDYHHGNGTQDLLYRRGDVLFVSLHANPEWEYPLYWGYADETGEGDGEGLTLNVPLEAGIGDDTYLAALAGALDRIRDFAPRHLVVSAGLDLAADDLLGTFRVSPAGVGRVGAALADLGVPTVLVQEGGYNLDTLGDLVRRLLEPFA